ncbi:MAG: porin [Pseudomonadota bacterium]
MKLCCFAILALGACATQAHAQARRSYTLATPAVTTRHGLVVIDVASLRDPDMADSATRVFGYPGKRMGLESAAPAPSFMGNALERDGSANRAWGMSVGMQAGPVSLRLAHQNKNVARIGPALLPGNRMDAKNSIVAAHVDLGGVKVYAAYSANRGWGSSPLWNPDNPYGALMASSPSTDSRDVLVGVALPLGRTTLLATLVRKNDRDLANRDVDQLAVGATYALSRHTDFYTAWSLIKPRSGAGYQLGTPLAPSRGSPALNLGMRHAF